MIESATSERARWSRSGPGEPATFREGDAFLQPLIRPPPLNKGVTFKVCLRESRSYLVVSARDNMSGKVLGLCIYGLYILMVH